MDPWLLRPWLFGKPPVFYMMAIMLAVTAGAMVATR